MGNIEDLKYAFFVTRNVPKKGSERFKYINTRTGLNSDIINKIDPPKGFQFDLYY